MPFAHRQQQQNIQQGWRDRTVMRARARFWKEWAVYRCMSTSLFSSVHRWITLSILCFFFALQARGQNIVNCFARSPYAAFWGCLYALFAYNTPGLSFLFSPSLAWTAERRGIKNGG
jgi:hypothetical protein